MIAITLIALAAPIGVLGILVAVDQSRSNRALCRAAELPPAPVPTICVITTDCRGRLTLAAVTGAKQ